MSMIHETTINNTNEDIQYRTSKKWQIFLYSTSQTCNNAFMFLFMMVSYYATGILGLGTVAISMVLTGTRMFDGLIDPFIGLLVDKTKWRFGKIRLFMVLGYSLMTIMTLTIFFLLPVLPSAVRIIAFVVCYLLYIIGYSTVNTISYAGQTVMTNHPKQRPLLGGLFTVYNIIFFSLASLYLSNYLAPKYGGLTNEGLFKEFSLTVILLAGIFVFLTVLSAWEKDIPENFEAGGEDQKVSLKDMWKAIKDNKMLQILVITASVDKLALQIASNSVINVMLFGIVLGNYALQGTLSAISAIPNLLVVFFGIRYAAKFGMKKGFVGSLVIGIIATTLMILLLIFGDTSQISFNNFGIMTIGFVVLYLIIGGIRYISMGLIMPMFADVIDYETYRSGRNIPGVISTLYSLVDNFMSSFANAVVGFAMALIGFREVFPDIETPLSNGIFNAAIFLAYGILLVGWILSVAMMRKYDLDNNKMTMIQSSLREREKQK